MMASMWEKASTSYSRKISEQDRATRKLSLRRLYCKIHPQIVQLLAEFYFCADLDSYDDSTADVIVLCLETNANVRDAVENRILSAFDSEGDLRQEKALAMCNELNRIAEDALRKVDRFYTSATRVRVRTEVGSRPNVTYTASEENKLSYPFPELPHAISSLRPTIAQKSSLKRLGPAGRFGIVEGIDRVQWSGHEGVFAYKRAGTHPEATIHEIELLLQYARHVNGITHTLQVSAVVVDARSRLRGFLSPFEPYGSLEEVFINRRPLPPPGLDGLRLVGSVVFPRQLEWKEKLRWAALIARGVASLHDGAASLGPLALHNLNPRNILISGKVTPTSSKNTIPLITGFQGAASPTGSHYARRWAAPERWRRATYEIGTALDVANLGMVLWTLAEENFNGFPDIWSDDDASSEARRDSTASMSSRRSAGGSVRQGRSDLWKKENPVTPGWFRLLVESCVEDEPARRPRAAEVAAALERQLQFSQQQ